MEVGAQSQSLVIMILSYSNWAWLGVVGLSRYMPLPLSQTSYILDTNPKDKVRKTRSIFWPELDSMDKVHRFNVPETIILIVLGLVIRLVWFYEIAN